MKILAHDNCTFEITVGTKEEIKRVKPGKRFQSHSLEIHRKSSKKSNSFSQVDESLVFNSNQDSERKVGGFRKNYSPKESADYIELAKPKHPFASPKDFQQQLIEVNEIDVFLENDYGKKFVPKKKEKPFGISYIDENATNRLRNYSNSRDKKILLTNKKNYDRCVDVQVKKKQAYQMYISHKLNLADRHNQIKNERIEREIAEEEYKQKRFINVSWIFLIKSIKLLSDIPEKLRMLKIRKFYDKIADRRIRRLQRFLRRSPILCEDRETKSLMWTRYATRMVFVFKRPVVIRQVSEMIGVQMYSWGRTSHLNNHFQSFVQTIRQIQTRFRYSISWKKKQRQILDAAFEKEIMYANEWEVSRQKNMAAKKLPKDKFQVSNNLQYQSKGSCNNFSDYLLNLDLLDFIDYKFECSKSDILQTNMMESDKLQSPIKRDICCEYKVAVSRRSIKSQNLDQKENDDDKKSILSGLSNINATPYLRYQRSKLNWIYSTNRWNKFAGLVKKAKANKEDFLDFEQRAESKKVTKKTFKRIKTRSKKRSTTVDSELDPEDEEQKVVEMLMQMTWNKNLRASMPKQKHQIYKPDIQLIRSLIYYICYNCSKNTMSYDYLEDFEHATNKCKLVDCKNRSLDQGLLQVEKALKREAGEATNPEGRTFVQNICKVVNLLTGSDKSEIETKKSEKKHKSPVKKMSKKRGHSPTKKKRGHSLTDKKVNTKN